MNPTEAPPTSRPFTAWVINGREARQNEVSKPLGKAAVWLGGNRTCPLHVRDHHSPVFCDKTDGGAADGRSDAAVRPCRDLCTDAGIWKAAVAVYRKPVPNLRPHDHRNEAPKRPEDSETQLARIGHRLARLYQIMQENRRRVDEERQELQTLVSDISHQVKTPVSNLKMATDTLLEKPMTEAERTDFIRGIRSQTDKLDFLFQALVKTSRLETGVIQLDKKPACLFDTVAQAMSGIVYAAEKKKIAVSVDCPENLTFSHDSKWTSEALFNLLDNAVKYTSAGGKIAVSVVLWEMYVEIKVSDTGKGISESNQAAIFRASIVKKRYMNSKVLALDCIWPARS